ncbi:glycosyl hydrolase, BNR repeat-containing protein, partial [mine drainage metagenome]
KAGKQTPVKIVVSNAQGQVIATRWGPAKAGINRFAWDMTWDGYTRLDFGDRHIKSANNSGPMALPGNYTVTISANGVSKTVPVTVQYDPNQKFAASANAATLVNALALRNQVDALNQMLNRLSAWQTALHGYATTAENASSSMDATQRALLDQAKALDKQVTALRDSIYNPLLQHEVIEDDIHYLQDLHANLEMTYGLVSGLQDQAPTPPMHGLMQEYGGQLMQKLDAFNGLLGNGVAQWNAAAYKAGAPTLAGGAPIGVVPAPLIRT